jgi:hypothetical protein
VLERAAKPRRCVLVQAGSECEVEQPFDLHGLSPCQTNRLPCVLERVLDHLWGAEVRFTLLGVTDRENSDSRLPIVRGVRVLKQM